MVLIDRERFLKFWKVEGGLLKIVPEPGSPNRERGCPMQDSEELWWALKRIEENIEEFGMIRTILEIGVADGGGFKIWEQILPQNKESLLIGIDFSPNVLWNYRESPIDIKLIKGDTHHAWSIERVKQILKEKGNRNVDLLFIDGQHHSTDVEKDFIDYGGFVADNRLVFFHDTRLCRSFWDRFTGGGIDAIDGSKEEYMVFKKEEYKNSLGTGIFYKLPNQNVVKFRDI